MRAAHLPNVQIERPAWIGSLPTSATRQSLQLASWEQDTGGDRRNGVDGVLDGSFGPRASEEIGAV